VTGDTSFPNDFELLFKRYRSLSYETVCEATNRAGGRYEKHHKGSHRHFCISFPTVRCNGHSHYGFPGRVLCNHLQSSPGTRRHRLDTHGHGLNDLSIRGSAMAINLVTDRHPSWLSILGLGIGGKALQ